MTCSSTQFQPLIEVIEVLPPHQRLPSIRQVYAQSISKYQTLARLRAHEFLTIEQLCAITFLSRRWNPSQEAVSRLEAKRTKVRQP